LAIESNIDFNKEIKIFAINHKYLSNVKRELKNVKMTKIFNPSFKIKYQYLLASVSDFKGTTFVSLTKNDTN